MKRTTVSERGLVLAPHGRDASLATAVLQEAGIEASACPDLTSLLSELDQGVGFVVLTEEAIATADLHALSSWLDDQEEWSDLPVILLTNRGGGLERNPSAGRYLALLGNVTFLERPFHPTTFVSLAQAALRGRRRQYEARARLEALREGEERYRTLFETMDEGFCVIEFLDGPEGPLSDYIHVEANGAFERHAGIPQAVGQRVRAIVPEEADEWVALYRDVLLTGRPIRFERELVATQRHLELAAFRVGPPSRRQVAVLFQDVTVRKRAEIALRELNDTLETRVAERTAERDRVWRLSQDLLGVADDQGRWISVSPAWTRLLGWRPDEIVGRTSEWLEHPDDRDRTRAEVAQLMNGRATFGFENRFRGKDGTYHWLSWTAVPEAGLLYCNARDVTAEKEQEAALEAAQVALRQAQKMEAIGQLTGGVAHDFNNLLTPIIGALDLLQRRELGGPREQRLIAGAIQSGDRAKTLVQRLLAFARRQPLRPGPVDIGQLVSSMADLIESTTGPQVTLSMEIGPDLPPAIADANQLEMALLNLGVNARDAMPEGGTLRITAKADVVGPGDPTKLQPGRYVRLSVSDDGVGMSEETLARAIEPFFSTKGIGKGTGLGLSMVHGLAAQLGGALAVESRLGKGTTVDLWLPASTDPVAAASSASEAPRRHPQAGTVLLVDDEDLVRMSTADMLAEMGYDVVEARSAEEALQLVGEGLSPDVLVTDHLMPGINGTELARLVRSEHPGIGVLIVSGYAETSGIAPDLPRLTKPFRSSDLADSLAGLGDR